MRGTQSEQQFELSDALWERLQALVPEGKSHVRGGRPNLTQRVVANAIFFVLRTGCQWKALSVRGQGYRYFQAWEQAGVFSRFWALGLQHYDELRGIDWEWMSMDGAMTKAPLGGEKTGPNPTDRAKDGTKRSLLTDGRGVPIGLAVDGANRHDMKLVEATLESVPVTWPQPTPEEPQNLCLDKGYDFAAVRELAEAYRLVAHIKTRGEEAAEKKSEPGFKARRWVVERTHGWMNRYRRLLIRWEKKAQNYVALLHFVCGIIAFRAAGVLG